MKGEVVDYTNEISGTYFENLEVLEGKGKATRGLMKAKNPTSDFYGILYDASLSKECEHPRDEAFVCVQCDETIEITKEQYEIF